MIRYALPVVVLSVVAPMAAVAQQSPPTVAVGTIVVERRAVSKAADFVGRVEAINRVSVRARVTGFLDVVHFHEGEVVKENAPLYQIEKGLFEAAVQQAEGAVEKSKAALVLAKIQLERAEELLKRNSGTVVARDQALAAEAQARGAVLTDEANLRNAQINLGYTDIVSPIEGKIGRTNITKGNVVGPDTGVLTTIVSQDPMYVTFPVSQREFLRAQDRGTGSQQVKTIRVRIRLSDGRVYDKVGEINFVDVSVDRATDSVTVRASMPNPNGDLIDGQLVRVALEGATPEERVVVPQAALIADQGGVYVFIVEDGKAVVRRVKTQGESGSDIIIAEGLSGGEQLIVEGLQAVRPGAAVRATPVQPTVRKD